MTAPTSPHRDGASRVEGTESTGELITQLSEQTSRLVHDEIQLAQSEFKETAKHAVRGTGLFGAAGAIALYGVGALVAAAIAALALVLALWASALIVGAALLVVAAVAALAGKSQVRQVSPKPQRTMDSVRRDVAEIRQGSHHDAAH